MTGCCCDTRTSALRVLSQLESLGGEGGWILSKLCLRIRARVCWHGVRAHRGCVRRISRATRGVFTRAERAGSLGGVLAERWLPGGSRQGRWVLPPSPGSERRWVLGGDTWSLERSGGEAGVPGRAAGLRPRCAWPGLEQGCAAQMEE